MQEIRMEEWSLNQEEFIVEQIQSLLFKKTISNILLLLSMAPSMKILGSMRDRSN